VANHEKELEKEKGDLGEHSVLFLNKDLLNQTKWDWNEQGILERAQRLSKAAIKVWPHARTRA